jgi:formylglycine-generating enzyme required for sulfatase activity
MDGCGGTNRGKFMQEVLKAAAILALTACLGPQASAEDAVPEPLTTFSDCDDCPEMIVLPRGSFTMGAGTKQEKAIAKKLYESRDPVEVTIGYDFAIGKFEVTVREYGAFVDATGHQSVGPCVLRLTDHGPNKRKYTGTKMPVPAEYAKMGISLPPGVALISDGGFRQPGMEVTPDHPATCLSRIDVDAYLAWLSGKTGRKYRLPSSAEWEYAARAGTQAVYFWGNDKADACAYANFADAASAYNHRPLAPCREAVSYEGAAPVGSYKANAWGLHDTAGNVQDMVADCFFTDYRGIPTDGSPWLTRPDDGPHDGLENGECTVFVARGFGFDGIAETLAVLSSLPGGWRNEPWNIVGFRVAVSLGGPAWDLR